MMNHAGESLQKSTAIYRSPDDVNNLKIRVRLRQGLAPNSDDEGGHGKDEGEIKVFSWQQKVYGKFEREFYKDGKNCVTDLERRYHEDVAKLVQNDEFLFTYVNQDEFCAEEESCVLNSNATSELCKQMSGVRVAHDEAVFSFKDPDGFNFKRSLISSLNNPYGGRNNFELMYIMADLGEYVGDTWLKSEYILCAIKYDQVRKLLVIFPDFTSFEPYFIQTNGDAKRIFQYWVEDASEKMSLDVLLKENEILNKISSHQAKLKLQKAGTDFELAPKNNLRVHLFFEILSAKNFEYNDIYVQYFVDLPENWLCKDPSSLKGTTQSCRSFTSDNLSYFGFPFEVCLEYDLENLEESSVPQPPYVYFEVISKDSWDRFRTEGLTYTILPISQPGIYRYDLHCLRICPKGPAGNLRRFFIGDCSSYADITWTSAPKDYDLKVINKYGTDTVGTGQISVRINVLHQAQALASEKRQSFILEKLNMSTLVKSIGQVLEAFKAAKRKMIEARKNV